VAGELLYRVPHAAVAAAAAEAMIDNNDLSGACSALYHSQQFVTLRCKNGLRWLCVYIHPHTC